ncbi:MAG: heavy metal translocating P-type ATPase, partial [Litorivicinaceae bacterium]|nr:heavy metal translocating P-type ATPase [Litorivicinaceae bacterium]
MYSYSLQIQGMTCGGCAASVQRKLDALEDIVSCEVNFATETARIESQEALKPKQLIDWIRSFGFSVQTDHQRFQATDDRFDQASLDLILSTHPEVVSYQINSPLKTLDYTTLPDANDRDLQNQLTHQGLVKATHQDVAIDRTSTTDRTHVWISGILALPLVLQMIGMWFGSNWHLPVLTEWALATPIQFWLGYRFYQGAWAALKRGEANMDTLVALGTTVAYFYSLFQWATFGQDAIGHLYFEASAVVITLVLVGKAIEAKAKHSALESVAALFALKPKTVTCLRHAQEIELSIQELVSGDVLIIRSGERIGADGVIIKGDAEIDASAMTGESIPEYKVTGDSVISGTLVVNGTIRVSAERVGDASTVSQVAALVKNAQMGKAPIQQLVDRISRIFVPTALILALLTLVTWLFVGETLEYALVAAISV